MWPCNDFEFLCLSDRLSLVEKKLSAFPVEFSQRILPLQEDFLDAAPLIDRQAKTAGASKAIKMFTSPLEILRVLRSYGFQEFNRPRHRQETSPLDDLNLNTPAHLTSEL